MELWAGFECTRNRVDDVYHDQLVPHHRDTRKASMERLPDLGVKAFRYRIAWDDPDLDWDVIEADLSFLADNNITPIIGLLHHGSGPPDTDLLSPTFADGLARHAEKIAERFGSVGHWTPVNEPLTTARFSALYGHWYPHARNERDCWLALLNQVDATRLAMHEIRRQNPAAKLVQTEDLGRTYATAALTDQAAFDNERRWMTWDLLTGRVVVGHAFYDRLCRIGFDDRLRAIADDPCPPDIIGVDHYLTSDRFLDHRLALYPAHNHGSNGQIQYADVEAVRVLGTPPDGLATALTEAWDRYEIPVALTECHNGCTREEQMRWLCEGWKTAERLNSQGKQIIAVTSWALTGAHDWSSLATERRGDFESGAFDPRGGIARPTGIAKLMKSLANADPLPIAANGQGWWRREGRLRGPPAPFARRMGQGVIATNTPPLLIAGATGTLGQAMLHAARARGLLAISTSRQAMALDCADSVKAAIERYRPWAVINATGWVRVDDAESNAEACESTNIQAALTLARCCEDYGIPNVHFSSDLVFDGQLTSTYRENDLTQPLNVYGLSKAKADEALLRLTSTLVVRTAAFFSPFDSHNFAVAVANQLRDGGRFNASADHKVSPTYVPHLANLVLDLVIDGVTGLWHVSNAEELSWHDFARRIAEACNLVPDHIDAVKPEQLGWIAERPLRSGLNSVHGQQLPDLDRAIREFAAAA